jgi:hypothetical protein
MTDPIDARFGTEVKNRGKFVASFAWGLRINAGATFLSLRQPSS